MKFKHLALAGISSCLLTLSANAASVIVSATAPTLGAEGISQTSNLFAWSFNTSQSIAQSFTTGTDTGGYSLNAVTILQRTALTGLVGTEFAVRISTLDAVVTSGTGTVNYVTTGTAQTGFTYTGDIAANSLLTFNLTPVALDPSTIYSIEFDVVSNGTGSGFSGQAGTTGSSTFAYADGNAYQFGATFPTLPSSFTGTGRDLTFYADISVPEPSAALLGGLGLLALLRRRR